MSLHRIQSLARTALPEMTDDLRALVELETPSDDKELLTAGLAEIEEWTRRRLGPPDERRHHDGGPHGDMLELLYEGTSPETVLVLCHYDTVWPAGTLAEWPFRITEDGRASGPGVFDMKCGLMQAVWALRLLRELDLPRPAVRLFLNGDEEIGSPASQPHVERLSEGVAATLVCEASAGPEGALKTRRKGGGIFELTVEGVEAHAGLEPERGASAVHALAELVTRMAGLGDPELGTTVNVGVISGGTGRNVVAGRARCGIDVRIAVPAETARVDAAFAALRPSDPRVSVTLTGGWARPPMVPNPASQLLFKQAQAIAAELGWTARETSVGGASDGNFVAALGRPVLDGLGAVGDGAHARHEHVVLEHLPDRTALIAGLLTASAG
ncbi:carboxypeptidase G2 precursor [Streptomyces lincolnensis]|uniref:Carboxypeptidase G2 n=1 Tax=Streptomyces lincolnensis TaxID=1915 RepID=A0A1B1M9C0_STRLN|nr:M20 family metallopeptidase [Streptomyces lincolnensis]ANS65228.1 carboxypeptidase G2 precursor [Streptomyces lincolnensis]AXG56564.1 carboxypeptidase G2 precursor [Streptomyces lincolnensis]QMV07004.1 M20/M25/M40 family metallo-hydrolase [Streptomyces lincolnensis]